MCHCYNILLKYKYQNSFITQVSNLLISYTTKYLQVLHIFMLFKIIHNDLFIQVYI